MKFRGICGLAISTFLLLAALGTPVVRGSTIVLGATDDIHALMPARSSGMPHFSARITQFSLWGVLPKSGNLKYMIWDASNSNLLFDQIVAAAPLATASLLYSDPFSLTLNGGSTYFFTEITDWDFSDTAYLEKTFKNPNQDK